MTSDQYVESVKQMMDQQNNIFNVFIAILVFVLGFIGVVQWKLSAKQIEQLKQETKNETIKEIRQQLEVTSLTGLRTAIQDPLEKRIIKLSDNIKMNYENMVEINSQFDDFKKKYLDFELTKVEKDYNPFPYITHLIVFHEDYLKKDIKNLNYFVSRISRLTFHIFFNGTRSFENSEVDIVIEKLEKIAANFSEESSNLEGFKAAIKNFNASTFTFEISLDTIEDDKVINEQKKIESRDDYIRLIEMIDTEHNELKLLEYDYSKGGMNLEDGRSVLFFQLWERDKSDMGIYNRLDKTAYSYSEKIISIFKEFE